jgi:hypothetical protein
MQHFRHVGIHPEDTAEGAVLAPGESTEGLASFDPKDPHNKRLIDEGIFLPIPEEDEKPDKAKTKEGTN